MSLPLIPLLGQGGTIAFPTLRATSTYRDNTFQSSHNVTLPSGTTTGDLVILFGGFAASLGTQTVDVLTPSGWTKFGHTNIVDDSAEINAWWTIAPGALSSVTLSRDPSADTMTARCNAYTFSAHSHTVARPPVITSIPIQLSTTAPNPASLTVPALWGAEPHVTWITGLWKFGSSNTSSAPSGYGSTIGTTDGELRMASARRNAQAATEDAGAWTLSSNTGGMPFTIAVRGPE